jgi:cation:H+ antiporter
MTTWAGVAGMLAGGLVVLVIGGELLVRGSARLADSFGVAPLVIGLTVVAFGTSAPELAVSIRAGLGGNPDIALGNVAGSNIFNVLFILGLCALILPLTVSVQLVRREVPIMIGVSILLLLLAFDGRIGTLDGVLLFSGVIIYTSWSIIAGRREPPAAPAGMDLPGTAREPSAWIYAAAAVAGSAAASWLLGRLETIIAALIVAGAALFAGGWASYRPGGRAADTARQAGFIVAGLGFLVLGAAWLVESSSSIARAFGVSELLIGLTIVAAGTSLPEVATSVVAAVRGQRDIAIGNVVGSNIFNILCILGAAALVTPGGLPVNPLMVSFDLPIMIAVAVVCLPIFFTGFSIDRWEGALFFASYLAYTAFLVLSAIRSPALETLTSAMLVIGPLVVVVLGWTTWQALRNSGRQGT